MSFSCLPFVCTMAGLVFCRFALHYVVRSVEALKRLSRCRFAEADGAVYSMQKQPDRSLS